MNKFSKRELHVENLFTIEQNTADDCMIGIYDFLHIVS